MTATASAIADRYLATWNEPDAAPVAGGTDVARLDDAGRIVEVIGFLDGSVDHA